MGLFSKGNFERHPNRTVLQQSLWELVTQVLDIAMIVPTLPQSGGSAGRIWLECNIHQNTFKTLQVNFWLSRVPNIEAQRRGDCTLAAGTTTLRTTSQFYGSVFPFPSVGDFAR
jgi:hypothetical protein